MKTSEINGRQIWFRKCSSFEEADKADLDYYMQMPPEEKLNTLQLLRESYPLTNRDNKNENRKGLRRSVKIVQQQ